GAIPTNHPTITSTFDFRQNRLVKMQLVTNAGLVIASTDTERALRQLPYPESIVKQIQKGKGAVIGETTPSFKNIVAYKPLEKTLGDMKGRLKSSYDRLLQSEKMALMGQVVAGIAHELNNPLTIVIGHTELMMMKGVDEEHRQPLTRIHDGAERASKIVKNLLTFARQRKPERK